MPRVALTPNTPVEVYKSSYGSFSAPSMVSYRPDPEDSGDTTVYSGGTSDITVGGTDPETDGFPVLAGEAREVRLHKGQSLWLIAGSTLDVYFDTFTNG